MIRNTIDEWHNRLHDHFVKLRRERDSSSPGGLVFALEHGLDAEEDLPKLDDVVRSTVAEGPLPSQAWLPLVVYAAEIGYRYEGDKYWPVFEAETPGWAHQPAGREYIRKKYELFAKMYGGACPSGRWAMWFRNIAWPITHAVLPTDLQRHLARLLSDYRHAFTAELLKNHEELGKRLAARSVDTSSRFRQFAENASLLGLVAASLLGDEDETTLLSSKVLHRIVVDLSRERQSGTWLKNAKRKAVQVRREGLLRGTGTGASRWSSDSDKKWPNLEVMLSLRWTAEGWTVYVTVPSFESLAHRFPIVRDELERIRCRVGGVQGVRARGSLMYQQGPMAMEAMPTPMRSMVVLEGASQDLSRSMVDHCRLPADPWLFRLAEPGLATIVRTKVVRPGQSYILLTQQAISEDLFGDSVAVDINTTGVHGLQFTTPDEFNDELIDTIGRLGLSIISDLVVWPAGLVAASWDREGRAAWPAGESPIIGIQSNRRVANCMVSTTEESIEFVWPEEKDTVFLKLTNLAIGSHIVEINLMGSDEPPTLVVQGQFEVRLLEPADSSAAAGRRQGLQTLVHPARPTLEELWKGPAALVVYGSRGERVSFEIRLLSRGGQTIVARKFSSKLPVSEKRWRELLRGVQGNLELESSVGQAEEMLIVVSNPVLGLSEIRAERPFEPLRWNTGYDRDGPFARLIDHMGSDDLRVYYYDVNLPSQAISVALNENGEIKSSDGALIIARAGNDIQAAVVLPPHMSGGLESLAKLSVRPTIETESPSVASIRRMVELAYLWTQVSLPSDQNAARLQSQVNDAIVAHISGMIGGRKWQKLERDVFNGHLATTKDRLLRAIGNSRKERETAEDLSIVSLTSSFLGERTDALAASLDAHGWCDVTELVSPILRLATVPGTVDLADPLCTQAIDTVLKCPAIIRLTRYFVFMISGDRASDDSLLLDWPWE